MVEKEVSLKSGEFNLAGTLALPASEGKFPAVLLIAGSGQVDRNENHKKMPLNVFFDITEHLVKQGFATLRYDKRGVGASDGNFWETGFFDNVADAAAALDFLKAQEGILPDSIFLLGHSEGAVIATRLAGNGADVAGAILLAGTSRQGEDVLKWQALQVAKGIKGINKFLLKLLRIDIAKSQQKQLDKIKRSTKDWYRVQLISKMNAKWMREFLGYNPGEDMSNISVPVLAMTGSKDIQADPGDLKLMSDIIKADFEYYELPDITHILRVEEGEPSLASYKKQVRQPIAPLVLEHISDWLGKQVSMPQDKN